MKIKQKKQEKNYILRKVLIVLFWLVLWQIISWVVGNVILLEGPIGVLKRLLEDLQTMEYYKTVGMSVLYINSGLVLGVLLAVIFSMCAWKQKVVEEFLAPIVQFFKAAPIACFIVLLLIWIGSENLSFYVALLVAFPPVYLNLLEGLKQIPTQQIELAKVYCMPFANRMKYVYLPSIEPYFMSALSLVVGMVFKAAVAAEIIGTPDFSMGERIYMSKIYLDTAGVLSWMLTVILASYVCEKLFVIIAKFCFRKGLKYKTICKKTKAHSPQPIILENVSVGYNDMDILKDVSARFDTGKTYCIVGASGIGKTTLLRSIWKLQSLKGGSLVQGNSVIAAVFQENRLFEEFTAVENILATGQCLLKDTEVMNTLVEILPVDSLTKPIKEFSGGMKRRVEIARAMLAESGAILMDEPFNGLDVETKEKTALFIKKYQKGRTLLFTSHHVEDMQLLDGEEINLWKKE